MTRIQPEITTNTPAIKGVYIAILNQTGTANPLSTVIKNTLGGEIVWVRLSPGNYTGTLTNAFEPGKTHILISNNGSSDGKLTCYLDNTPNGIFIEYQNTDFADNWDASIEIKTSN